MGIQVDQIPDECAGYITGILEHLDISSCEELRHIPLSHGWEIAFQKLFFQRKAVLLEVYRDNRLLSNLIHGLGWEKPPEHQTHDKQSIPTFGTVKLFPNQLYRKLLEKYAA